jgi:hypothetical protein
MATSTPFWHRLIWAVMFLVVCEGALRKWAFPGVQQQIYLLKDALLMLAYLGFLFARPPAGAHLSAMTGLKSLVMMTLVYFGLQVWNPNSPSILLSLFGFKNYLLYVPLAFVVPNMFSSSEDVERKLQKYACLMIPFAALGLVQFAFPPDHWINGYVSNDSENLRMASMFGESSSEHARTSGTFPFTGGYTTFLSAMVCLGAALATNKKWRISGNLWPLLLVVVSIAAMFTTGSRGPIYYLIITSPLMFFIWRSAGLVPMTMMLRIVAMWAIITVAISLLSSGAIEAYQYRAAHADDPVDRILAPITEAYRVLGETPIIGTGMASTHGAAINIMGTDSFWWLQGVFVEPETGRILQETGIIGFILIYAARVWLLLKAITLGVRFRTPLYAAMSGAIAAFFAQFLYGIVVNNPTAGIYYWFAAGLLFGMYRLELQKSARSLKPLRANEERLHGWQPAAPVRHQ